MERQPLLRGPRNTSADAVDLADVPELIGVRLFHLRLLGVAFLFESVAASIISFVPYILSDLIAEYDQKRYEVMMVHSCLMFGAIVGAFSSGLLSDKYGRKTCLSFCCGAAALLALVHLLLPGSNDWFIALLVLRFFLGICFGGILATRLPYILEFVPDSMRGRVTGIAQMGWPVTASLCILIAKTMDGSWRVLLALPAVFGGVAFVVLCCMPESVRWLFVSDRQDDGYNAIRNILSSKVIMGPDPQLVEPPHIMVPKACTDNSQQRSVLMQLRSLLGNEWRQTTIIASLLFIATAGSSYAALMWVPHTVKMLSGAETHMYELFIWVEIVGLLSLLAVSAIVDMVGRRASYVISAIAAAVCEATLPWTIRTSSVTALYVNLLAKTFFMSINWTAMLTYIAEAFPTPLRGSGAGCAACLGRLSAALVPIAVGALLEVSATFAFCFIAAVLLCGAVAALFMPQEMANVKLRDDV
eukprot:gnl/MRDRNA2_/MRDRNA2_16242_c0_seq1.p1 gnl/MRDRNA2_/MRDRNA2_16242_c0~~gnl/MRDRNA2_/MRDRNA2_16242_c0_seq1.p1  ORF type:complete len:472 (+),score=77.09 gnl/MRDRNA2_/MRDRNA2_16242_c0_seq1:94-1509(+)